MKFCVVELGAVMRGVPWTFVGSVADVRDKVPRYLKRLHRERADVSEYELLNRDADLLLRSGTVYATRRVVWHRTRAT